MATQQANKAKWTPPPYMRKVATSSSATEQVDEQVKKSQWTPPHLMKAQEIPVTPISKPARSSLNANSPEFKPVAFMHNSPSSIRSISPTENASPATVKSASPVSAKSKSTSFATHT